MLKKALPILLLAFFLSACGSKTATKTDTKKGTSPSTKILLNELAVKDRPFVTLVPHSTNKLFTFVGINLDKATESSLDIEYQSGDLLKGVSANVDTPIPNHFIKAIILGSCSTGGKCSFDKDLKSGTTKLRLKYAGQDAINLLKGDFTFILGQSNLPDGKVQFEASKANIKDNLILMNSFGLPKQLDKEISLYPVIISSTSDKAISGKLTLTSAEAKSAMIFDGVDYKPLTTSVNDGKLTVVINQKPWSMAAEITRDDEKGSKESLNLYLLGPIVLIK